MPIKNSTNENIPYLVNYEPFKLSEGQQEPSELNDMVSIDVQQKNNTPTIINYGIGSENDYELVINFKNLTNNATLDINVIIPHEVFSSTLAQQLSPTKKVINFSMDPLQLKQISIQLNKPVLDAKEESSIQTEIEVSVKNRSNGSIITKDINVSRLQEIYLPEVITVN